MSITAWHITARSSQGNDYGYVNIATTWAGKDMPSKPIPGEKTEAMWSHESLYGVVGSKVGDFIECYGVNGSLQEGLFTHREIAGLLQSRFTGLKINEIQWKENPLEKTLKSGKPRVKKAKWLPENPVDIVLLYSDNYIELSSAQPITTDFFTVIRPQNVYEDNWLMCTEEVAKVLEQLDYENLEIKKTTIADEQEAATRKDAETNKEAESPIIITIGKGYGSDEEAFDLESGSERFGDDFADREYYISGLSPYDRIYYWGNRVYAIDIAMTFEGANRNIYFDNPSLPAFEQDTLEYFKTHHPWLETKNKVHLYFPTLCLIFSGFGKKIDARGKRIRIFSQEQQAIVEEKYLKLT